MADTYTTWASQECNTTDPYIKYAIEIDQTMVYDPQYNKTGTRIRVNVYTTSSAMLDGYKVHYKLKIDGVETEDEVTIQEIHSGYVIPGPGGHINNGTGIYASNQDIYHELDGTMIVHLEAQIRITRLDELIAESVYQGFYAELNPIPRMPSIHVSYAIQYITEHSLSFNAMAEGEDLGVEPPPAPLPPPVGNPTYTIWYYSYDGGDSWVYFGTSEIVNDQSISYFRSSKKLVVVSGLEPSTSYDVILAMTTDVLLDPPEGETWDPNTAPYGVFAYSTKITLTTDGITPLPDVPSTRGVARRITLFDQDEMEFTSNGLGSLIEAFSCKVTEEVNGQFELEMEYPVDGRHFSDIDFGRIITANPNQYSRPQPFRIYSISKPHDGKITINAQHISYDLSGITIAPFRAGSAMGVLAEFQYGPGCLCDVPCPFQFWTDVYGYSEFRTYTPATIRSLMGGSDSSIQGIYGGEYEFDVYNVRLWTRRGVDRGVTIRYGKNLTSLKQDANCNNVYTGVRAFWYKEPSEDDPQSGGLVETSPKIIDIPGTFDYDKILLLDLSGTFDEKPTSQDLELVARQYIVDYNVGVPEVSLSVSFVQLSDSIEYQDISILEQVKLGDYVSVEFPKLNIRANGIECIKTVFNVMSQRYDSIDLGTPKTTLATTVSNNSQVASNSVSKSEMQHAINTSTGDSSKDQMYVVMDRSVSPARLLVMDAAKQENATNIYKWSFDGLSHSYSGIHGPYSNIMKQDASEFNFPGDITCIKMTQVTPNMEVKNGHILKILRW